ncbi:MAG: 3-hydroxyacyl-ACP dehydratase FabZ [Burkholderiales bacterium]
MKTLEIKEILDYLPHRHPFLLVDRVLDYELGQFIVALKNVTVNEPFFPGHFPHYPVMPGVLLIEAMAQAAAILAFKTAGRAPGEGNVVYFAGIDEARFRRPIVPGDQITLRAELLRHLRGIWKFKCTAHVGPSIAADAVLMCTMRSTTAK